MPPTAGGARRPRRVSGADRSEPRERNDLGEEHAFGPKRPIGEGRGCCCCVSGAEATKLVERWPRLPMLLALLSVLTGLMMFGIEIVGLSAESSYPALSDTGL
eukprot:COSAG02_NODE_48_length_45421_cov_103.222100_36_plen_103_part_00